MARYFTSPAIAIEGVTTGDGRVIADGALRWTTPFPFAWLQQSQHGDGVGNAGAVDMGNVQLAERADAGRIAASGVIDDTAGTPGADFCRKMDEGTAPLGNRWGVSVDVTDTVVEFVSTDPNAADSEDGALGLVLLASFSGAQALALWRSDVAPAAMWRAMTAAAGERLPDDAVVLMPAEPDTVFMRLVEGEVRGLTACAIAAFADAYVELAAAPADAEPDPNDPNEAAEAECPDCGAMGKPGKPCPDCGAMIPKAQADGPPPKAATAAGGPVKPPVAWFHVPAPVAGDERLLPQYDIDTGEYLGDALPLFIGENGQVYGHLGPAKRCHIGLSECMTIAGDTDVYDFSHFLIGTVLCDDGTEVATGALAVGCDHAPLVGLSLHQARDHYANVGLAWADVNVIDTPLGPWVCGATRPDVTDNLTRVLRGGGISGDWRGSGLSLVAVLAVSTPGFTVQRVRPLAASAALVDVGVGFGESVIRSNGEWAIITAPILRGDVVVASAGAGHASDGACCAPCRRTALVAAGAPEWALLLHDDLHRSGVRVDATAEKVELRTLGLVQSARDALAASFRRA